MNKILEQLSKINNYFYPKSSTNKLNIIIQNVYYLTLICLFFYPIYQTVYLLPATFGGYFMAYFCKIVYKTLKNIKYTPMFYFLYDKKYLVIKRLSIIIILYFLIILGEVIFCFGNITGSLIDFPVIFMKANENILLAFYHMSIYASPLKSFSGLLFTPYLIGFLYKHNQFFSLCIAILISGFSYQVIVF